MCDKKIYNKKKGFRLNQQLTTRIKKKREGTQTRGRDMTRLQFNGIINSLWNMSEHENSSFTHDKMKTLSCSLLFDFPLLINVCMEFYCFLTSLLNYSYTATTATDDVVDGNVCFSSTDSSRVFILIFSPHLVPRTLTIIPKLN